MFAAGLWAPAASSASFLPTLVTVSGQTGRAMPSADLFHFFQDDLRLQRQWWVSGKHYAKTCEDWLAKMNASKKEIWPDLEETYGEKDTAMWFYRWQIFYMACAELFAYEGGDTWGVCHYLFEKP